MSQNFFTKSRLVLVGASGARPRPPRPDGVSGGLEKHRSALLTAALIIAAAVVRGLLQSAPLWSQVAASQNPPSQATPTLKVRTEVVNIYAVVRDKKRLIPNLNQEDFEVTEDGVAQDIRYFSRETDTPLTMGILVDTSGSQQNVLPIEQEQADAFVGQVVRPKDLAFILHFDLEVELLQDLTGDKRLLTHAIDETVINAGAQGPTPGTLPSANVGGTHLYDAVYLSANDVLKGEIGRKVLILLTDGEDQGSRVKLDVALEAAQKSDIIIYAVDVVDRAFYRFRGMGFSGDSVLKKLGGETGGRVIRVDKPREAAAGFQEIADELRTQYFLGYSPSNTKHDGTFRKIQVRVHDRDYKVQARHGYYAPTQ
jgi:VWFA-related protein